MHTSLIFKYLYLNRVCTIFSIYTSSAIDFNSRLQKQVPVRPHFVHTTSITDTYSTFTYIARAIRPKLRTLYIISSPVLLSFDYGSVRDYTVVVRMNPCGSGGFCGINLRSCHGDDVNTTPSTAQYFGLMSYSPQH